MKGVSLDYYLRRALYWRLSQLELSAFDPSIAPDAFFTLDSTQIPILSTYVDKDYPYPYLYIGDIEVGDFSAKNRHGMTGTVEFLFLDRGTSVKRAYDVLSLIYRGLQDFSFDFSLFNETKKVVNQETNMEEEVTTLDLSSVQIVNFKLSAKNVNIVDKDLISGSESFQFTVI